jgi:hypothetical protein
MRYKHERVASYLFKQLSQYLYLYYLIIKGGLLPWSNIFLDRFTLPPNHIQPTIATKPVYSFLSVVWSVKIALSSIAAGAFVRLRLYARDIVIIRSVQCVPIGFSLRRKRLDIRLATTISDQTEDIRTPRALSSASLRRALARPRPRPRRSPTRRMQLHVRTSVRKFVCR